MKLTSIAQWYAVAKDELRFFFRSLVGVRLLPSPLPMCFPSQISGKRISDALQANSLKENGAPERIRTSDPQIRSLVLYPAELRAPFFHSSTPFQAFLFFLGRSGRI